MGTRGQSGAGKSGERMPLKSAQSSPEKQHDIIDSGDLRKAYNEALKQRKAVDEVLRAIASSQADLKKVLETVAENAALLCGADDALVFQTEGDRLRLTVAYGPIPNSLKAETINRGWVSGRAILERRTIHIPDLAEESYEEFPISMKLQRKHGHRTMLATPMFMGDTPLGVILIRRQEVQPFSEAQINLLNSFANQAAIAIENTRFVSELRIRNQELDDALEQQEAMGELLQAISTANGELAPVFDTLLRNAIRLCDAQFGILFMHENGNYSADAIVGATNELHQFLSSKNHKFGTGTATGRAVIQRKPVQIVDLREEVESDDVDTRKTVVELGGGRTIFSVPMMRGSEPIGAITIYRREVRPFDDKQIEMVSNFAQQAVIAVENAQLLNNLQEALDQQLATADILRVISTSPTNTQPVFDEIARHAARLCKAEFCFVFRFDGEMLHFVAHSGVDETAAKLVSESFPQPPGRGSAAQRAVQSGGIEQIADALEDIEYERTNVLEYINYKSLIAVPMLRDGKPIGAITVARKETGHFPERQVELLQTFAEQAVIAVENVRLFTELETMNRELNETLDQRTATAEVLKTISRSAFDLETVLQTLIESAVRLCNADQGTIARKKADKFYRTVNFGFNSRFTKLVQDHPVELDRGSATGRALLNGEIVHIPDVRMDPDYTFLEAKTIGGLKSILAVPMLREGEAIGVFALIRTEVKPFTSDQIELASTFADQAAIAIENVRLFEEAETRSRELAQSLEELRTAQDRLVQTEKLASLGQLTAGIAHEIKNPLNFVNNFSAVSIELLEELREAIEIMTNNQESPAEMVELMSMLKGNLEKITHHGQRADSIIKNMLMHARQGKGEYDNTDVNGLVLESLNLAYHGARAENQNFNITLEKSLDPSAGYANLNAQEIRRVLLNLLTNGFYAAHKRNESMAKTDYTPTLSVSTRDIGESVRIMIRDNGIGMPKAVRDQIFTPFFTTKPVGEGTGLGLSISHDIVVKQHGGKVEVDSREGEFTEFVITLPRAPSDNLEKARQ